ncbi:MAG TPA: hypothetical protein VGR78_08075 [Verrucomicrobiae bacterium]|nr:hypothetical protein [Verrucomicrobiae bacterium]
MNAEDFTSFVWRAGKASPGTTLKNIRHTVQPLFIGGVGLVAQALWRSFFWHVPFSVSVKTARMHLWPFVIGASVVSAAMLLAFVVTELCGRSAPSRTSRLWRAAHVVAATFGAILLFTAMLLVVTAP